MCVVVVTFFIVYVSIVVVYVFICVFINCVFYLFINVYFIMKLTCNWVTPDSAICPGVLRSISPGGGSPKKGLIKEIRKIKDITKNFKTDMFVFYVFMFYVGCCFCYFLYYLCFIVVVYDFIYLFLIFVFYCLFCYEAHLQLGDPWLCHLPERVPQKRINKEIKQKKRYLFHDFSRVVFLYFSSKNRP